MKSACQIQIDRRSREHWRRLWSRTDPRERRDMWYAIDEVKFEYLQRSLPSGGKSLEVGCGSARLSRFLASRGFETCGLDCEAEALRLARARFRDSDLSANLLCADAFSLPFDAASFDVVLSTGLLEHFAEPSPIVAEMARVLKHGGLFYSDIVPRKFSLMRLRDRLPFHRDGLWERSFSRQQITSLLARAGLTGITVFGAGVFPPLLPLVGRHRIGAALQDQTIQLAGKVTRHLDGTKAAEVLGFYYFATAIKPAGDGSPMVRSLLPVEQLTGVERRNE